MGIAFEKLASRYTGEVAEDYDASRSKSRQWRREQEIVESFVGRLSPEAAVLDVPVGTGRYLEFYKARGLTVTGADVSPDMLALARRKAEQLGAPLKADVADVTRLPYGDGAFDAVVCTRLFNWLDIRRVDKAVGEITRVTTRHVILGVQHWRPVHERTSGWNGAAALLRQTVHRARLRLRSDRPHMHSRRAVESALAAHGLAIVDVRDDIPSKKLERLGIRYAIYFLQKR